MAISNEELRKQLAEALKAVNAAQAQTQSLAQISALRKALEAAIPYWSSRLLHRLEAQGLLPTED